MPASIVVRPGSGIEPPTSLTGDTISMAAWVTDAFGTPVEGAEVTWKVLAGGGTIDRTTSATRDGGAASAVWILGPEPGENRIEASIGRAPIGTFSATTQRRPTLARPAFVGARPDGLAGTITLQWQPVPQAAAYNVYWGTTPGVTPTTGTKVAPVNATSWVHTGGSLGRTYYYVVSAFNAAGEGPPSEELSATLSPFSFTLHEPLLGQLEGDSAWVNLRVAALYEYNSVTAAVEGRVVPLRSFTPGQWSGYVPLVGIPRGPTTVTVTVTDVRGNVGRTVQQFMHDTPPRIVLQEPGDLSIVAPAIRVVATCSDDDPLGCASLSLVARRHGRDSVVATRPGSFDEMISLGTLEGDVIELRVRGRDRAGQETETGLRSVLHEGRVGHRIFVMTTGPRLTEVQRVSGLVLDVQGDRILHWAETPSTSVLRIERRTGGAADSVALEAGSVVWRGFLTPRGALFRVGAPSEYRRRLDELRGGGVTTIGDDPRAEPRVAGRYAVYSTWYRVTRLDLVEGTAIDVAATTPGRFETFRAVDVAPNGDVVYQVWQDAAQTGQVVRWRNGVVTTLGTANGSPRTDGARTIYAAGGGIPPAGGDQNPWRMLLHDGAQIELGQASAAYAPFRTFPGRQDDTAYRIAGGWAAYPRRGLTTDQVWVRSPAGEAQQLTDFGTPSYVDALGPDGVVVYGNRGLRRRWLARPPAFTDPLELPYHPESTVLFRDGKLLILLGRSVFEVSY